MACPRAQKRRWGIQNPDKYIELRYEDILASTEAELGRLCAFAGIPYSTDLLEFYRKGYATSIANSTTHAMLGTPINPANKEKWKTGMPKEDLEEFERIAGDALAAFGYPLSTAGGSGREGFTERARSFLQSGARRLSVRSIRVRLKNLLPGAILLCLRLGFRLDVLCNSRAWLGVESFIVGRRARRPPATR